MFSDELYMAEAIKEAKIAAESGEVPVGAILVFEDKIIARAHNQVEVLQDASAHAEMLCLKEGAQVLGNWRLNGAVLYCTLEPCSMCAGAMILSRLKKIVWGAPDLRHGADGSWIPLLNKEHPIHQLEVIRGILKEECAALLTDFFRMRRKEKAFK